MKLLLDTHAFLWFVAANPKLPATFRVAIQNPANELFLSVASVWEVVIKYQIGKLPLPSTPGEYMSRQRAIHGIASLPVDEGAMSHLARMPSLHNDPFDRLLVAQALQHGLTVVKVDPAIMAYPVAVLTTT